MEDYQQKVINEKNDLDIKIKNLQNLVESDNFDIKIINNYDRFDLETQLRAMERYSRILKRRINRF